MGKPAVLVLLSLSFALGGWAQTLTSNDQTRVVNKVIAELKDKYPFPEITVRIESALQQNLKSGAYSKITNAGDFAGRLTNDIQDVSKDRHLSLNYAPDPQKVEPLKIESVYPPGEALKDMELSTRVSNYGAMEARILPGNIGYLKFGVFQPLEFAGDVYAAAMRFIAQSDALIIDLRSCGGSQSVDAIAFFSGYLFEHPVHLTNFYLGGSAKVRQLWSIGYVPGPKYVNKPVYVLTSRMTFSGGEAFAYELQAQKRATVIGDVTGGGGNPNAMYPIDEHFVISVPFARVENPVTGTNWNEKGVQPDIAVPQIEALYRAQVAVLEKLHASAPEDKKWLYGPALDDLRAASPTFPEVTFKLKGHPNAKNVSVIGSFNLFTPWANPMKNVNGEWTTTVAVEPGRQQYLFLVDGQQVLDPANTQTNADKRANIIVVK
jgi:retinol-binding protein 3